MKSPRILLVVTDFPSPSETFILRKVVGLLERGADVRVACLRRGDASLITPDEKRLLAGRVRAAWPRRPGILAAGCAPLAFLHCLARSPVGTLGYLREAWKERRWHTWVDLYRDASIVAVAPDLIHFEFAALAAERPDLAQRLGCRMVVSLRGYDMAHAGLERSDAYGETWARVDAVHVLGESMRRLAIERGLDPSTPVHPIPPALTTSAFEPPAPTEGDAGPLRIVSVGRAHWTKGYDYALLAARELDRRGLDFHYRIVGGGPEIESLYLARHQLGLTERVEIVGMVHPGSVRDELARADLFLHAAVTEGFGNAVLEAQAMSLPVVTSDAGGLPENVEAGQTGLVVPRRDPMATADAIESLADQPEVRREMGRRGRERVEALFSLSSQIEAFLALYETTLEGA